MDMTDDEPSPQRRLITTRAEYQEAIDLLLPMAQRELFTKPNLSNSARPASSISWACSRRIFLFNALRGTQRECRTVSFCVTKHTWCDGPWPRNRVAWFSPTI